MSRQVLLRNPNRFTVPVTINRDGRLVEVKIPPRQSITIDRKEMTQVARNIVSSDRNLLIMKRV